MATIYLVRVSVQPEFGIRNSEFGIYRISRDRKSGALLPYPPHLPMLPHLPSIFNRTTPNYLLTYASR
ncbi:MAG: hypothetical protein QNJ41_22275 [Xenococcaceae cyanobacterium MO_188.B32]|nr:hypothetical protein [Xenococcaceae cyanobacterium MO_188.B32]